MPKKEEYEKRRQHYLEQKRKYYEEHKEHCKAYAKQYYQEHKEQINQHVAAYIRRKYREDPTFRKKFIESVVRSTRRRMGKIYELWHGNDQYQNRQGLFKSNIILGIKAEEVAFQKILPQEGFKNILWTRNLLTRHNNNLRPARFSANFPCIDFFGEKNGTKCAIEVTTTPYRHFMNYRGTRKLTQFFGLRYFICFIKPNLEEYILLEFKRSPSSFLLSEKHIPLIRKISKSKY